MTDLNNMTNAELLDEGFHTQERREISQCLIKRMEEAGERSVITGFLMSQ